MANLSVVPLGGGSTISQLVDDYLASAQARGLAAKTVDFSYGYPLRRIFVPWCETEGITTMEQLDSRKVDAFSAYLLRDGGKRGPLSRHSVHAYARSVRTFFLWCKREGETVKAEPQLPRLPRRVVEVLSREEIDDLEKVAPYERDKLIIRILADTGLRANELCSLRLTDIVRNGRTTFLKVQGKGARERLVPLLPPLYRRIERYVRGDRPRDTSSQRIFVSVRRGRTGDYECLTTGGILQLVQRTADRAGIRKRVYSHLLRHSWFTNGLRGGINAMTLARIGGHSSLRMLQEVYSHLDVDDDYHALARLMMGRE